MRSVTCINMDPYLVVDEQSVVACIRQIDAIPGYFIPEGSIGIAFVDKNECSRLHAAFFDDPEVTDVMTFPAESGDEHAGDIAICPAMAAAATEDFNSSFPRELTLYLVHSCLHLAGLRDHDKASRQAMRLAEDRVMEHLRNTGALLAASWKSTGPAFDA